MIAEALALPFAVSSRDRLAESSTRREAIQRSGTQLQRFYRRRPLTKTETRSRSRSVASAAGARYGKGPTIV